MVMISMGRYRFNLFMSRPWYWYHKSVQANNDYFYTVYYCFGLLTIWVTEERFIWENEYSIKFL